MESYRQAIEFLANRKYVCPENAELVAELFGTPIDVVKFDIQKARGSK
jgi:hypothetical protein